MPVLQVPQLSRHQGQPPSPVDTHKECVSPLFCLDGGQGQLAAGMVPSELTQVSSSWIAHPNNGTKLSGPCPGRTSEAGSARLFAVGAPGHGQGPPGAWGLYFPLAPSCYTHLVPSVTIQKVLAKYLLYKYVCPARVWK